MLLSISLLLVLPAEIIWLIVAVLEKPVKSINLLSSIESMFCVVKIVTTDTVAIDGKTVFSTAMCNIQQLISPLRKLEEGL